MKKLCSRCRLFKALNQFAQKTPKRREGHCKECQRKYNQEHYRKNKAQYMARNDRRETEIAAFVIELKKKPCTDCGRTYPHWVMDFDHLDASLKKSSIADVIGARHWGREKLLLELAKCELVCANCHRHRTYLRRHKKKLYLLVQTELAQPSEG